MAGVKRGRSVRDYVLIACPGDRFPNGDPKVSEFTFAEVFAGAYRCPQDAKQAAATLVGGGRRHYKECPKVG